MTVNWFSINQIACESDFINQISVDYFAVGSLPLLIQAVPHQALVCFAIFSLRLSSLISWRLSLAFTFYWH